MKIVLACRVYPTHRPGGMPFVCQDRARALAKLGHEVHVLTTSKNGGRPGYEIDNGVEVHYLECRSEVLSQQFAEGCNGFCQSYKPDIIHSDSLDVDRWWWCGFSSSVKTACTLHGFGWGAFFTNWNMFRINRGSVPTFNGTAMLKEKVSLNSFNTVIGISLHEHWMLRDLMGLSQAKLIYNPIADYFFDKPVLPTNLNRFLCASISGQNTRLFDVAKKAAVEAGVELITVSNKSRQEMPAVYDSVCAVIVPSAYSQGYDLTVAEAQARLRPVIVSDTGSYYREAMNPETATTMKITKLGDCDSIIEQINILKNDTETLQGNNSIYRHRPEFHAKKWLEAICTF